MTPFIKKIKEYKPFINNNNVLRMTDVSDALHDDQDAIRFIIRNNTYGNRILRFGRMYGNYLKTQEKLHQIFERPTLKKENTG